MKRPGSVNFARPRSLHLSLGLAFTLFPTASAGTAWASGGSLPHIPAAGGTPLTHAPNASSWGQAANNSASHSVHGSTFSFGATPWAAGHNGNNAQHLNGHLTGNTSLFGSNLSDALTKAQLGPNGLDLTSKQANYVLNSLGGAQTLTITVGGKSEVIDLQTKLTGAELVAANQVLSTGHQTLKLNAFGTASGGALTLSSQSLSDIDAAMGNITGLHVAHGVRVIDTVANLQFSGDLVNQGHISVQPSGGSGTIHAEDIINTAGASITAGKGTTLNLIANNTLANEGTISAANNVNISAPTIINTNGGVIESQAGNVNISNSAAISMIGVGGAVSAAQGNINVKVSGSAGGDIDISGGDYHSNQFNLDTTSGIVDVDAGDITGQVNIDACGAHVNAVTADLNLGTMNVTGDPTYYNQGNITITGAFAPTGGADLAIIAKGNIVSNGGSLDTSGVSGKGGTIHLVAGANFTTSDFSSSGNNNSTVTLTLNGGSTTGGVIDLTGGNGGKAPLASISTSGGGLFGNAGDINMAAFAGSGSKSGSVILPKTLNVDAGTSAFGNSGSIRIFAGATKGTAVSGGNFDVSRGPAGHGVVIISAETPVVSNNTKYLDGKLMSGGISGGAIQPAAIQIGNITTGGGNAGLTTAGAFSFNNINLSGSGGGSSGAGAAGGAAGFTAITAGSITGKNIYAFGGGGGGGGTSGTKDGSPGGAGGAGGAVILQVLTGSINLSGQINVSGGGGGGGAAGGYNGGAGLAGAGGMGGSSGFVQITVPGSLVVGGGIFAVDGAAGGDGATSTVASAASGGGGGGSYGGGGGGGAGNYNAFALFGSGGGGGGGGLYGGGGGSGAISPATPGAGGSGGGFSSGGAGGQGSGVSNNGFAGGKLTGGNGNFFASLSNEGIGGVLGFGGTGGTPVVAGLGKDGLNVVNGNAVTGGDIKISNQNGSIGTAKAPLMTLAASYHLANIASATKAGDFHLSNLAGISIGGLDTVGLADITAAGNIALNAPSTATTLNLTTAPGSGGGIAINKDFNGANTNFKTDGSGPIQQMAGVNLFTNNSTFTSSSGMIGNGAVPINVGFFTSTVSANTNNDVYLLMPIDGVLGASSSGSGNFTATANGVLTIGGKIQSSGGDVLLTGNKAVVVNANVSAGGMGGVVLATTASGNITEKKGLTLDPGSSGLLEFDFDKGSVGSSKVPFTTNAPTVYLIAASTAFGSAFINDTNTTAATVQSLSKAGLNLQVTSNASSFTADNLNWTVTNITDTAKGGSVFLANQVGSLLTYITSSGDINQKSGLLAGSDIKLTAQSGSIGNAGSIKLDPATVNHLYISGGKTTDASLNCLTGTVKLYSSNARSISLADATTDIFEPVTVSKDLVIVDSGASAMTQLTGATIKANNVVLVAQNDIVTQAPVLSKDVLINSIAGQISIGDKTGLGTGIVILSAKTSIDAATAKSFVAGDSVAFSANVLGNSFNALPCSANTLAFNAATGDAFINSSNTKSTSLSGSVPMGDLTFNSTAAVTINGSNLSAGKSITMTAASVTVPAGSSMVAMGGNLFLTTSGKGLQVDDQGVMSCTANMHLFTTGTSTINVGSGATLVGPTLKIIANTINNAGTITMNVLGFNTVQALKGDLLINNSGSYGTTNNFSASAPGKLTIQNTGTFNPFKAGTITSAISLIAGGDITIPTNTIAVHPDASNNGGVIGIQGASLKHPAGILSLSANAANSAMGNGGSITLFTSGNQAQMIDGTALKMNADASTMGGDGGSVIVFAKGSVAANFTNNSVSINKFGANANGGNAEFISFGLLQVTGTVDCAGSGTGSGGKVLLESLASTPLTVAKGTAINSKSNGIDGDVFGKDVTIATKAGIIVANGTKLASAGGQLLIIGSKLTNNGDISSTVNPASVIIANGSGDMTISGTGLWPTALIEQFSATGNLTIGTTNPLVQGVAISVAAGKTLTLNVNTIKAGQFFGAGSINLSAEKLAYSIAMPGPLVLNAQSTNGGGTIHVALTGKNAVTLDNAAAGAINIVATPTGGAPTSGSDVSVSSGGDLIVNLSGLSTNSGMAAIDSKVSLASGGNLKVNGNWSNSITGMGGSLSLASASSAPFVIGSPTVNGIGTAAVISTGQISVANSKGDVAIGGTDFLTGATSVAVTAGKNITGPLATEAIAVMTGNVALTSNGGIIGTPNGANIAPLQFSAVTISANAGKGIVSLQDNLAGAATLDASSAKTFALQTAQTLTVNAPLAASNVTLHTVTSFIVISSSVGDGTGTVSISSSGSLNQNAGTINAKTLSLTGLVGNGLQTNAGTISGTFSGNATINNVGAAPLTLNGLSGDIVTVTSAGPIVANGSTTGVTGVTLNSGGALTINGTVSAPMTALNSSNGGLISAAKTGVVSAVNLIATSDSGDINISKGSLNAVVLSVGTSGNVVLTDNVIASDVTLSSIVLPVKSLTFQGSSAGNLLLNNISTSNGSISIAWTGDDIITGAGTSLKTKDGNITLQQLNTTKTINLGANSTIYASSTKANLGNVNIVVGAVPNKGTLSTTPNNIFTSFTGKGQIFFGPAGKVKASAVASHVNAFDRNVLFNSNTSQIMLGDNVTITADPPLMPGEIISNHPLVGAGAAAIVPNTFAGSLLPNGYSLNSPSLTTGTGNVVIPSAASVVSSPTVQANLAVAPLISESATAFAPGVNFANNIKTASLEDLSVGPIENALSSQTGIDATGAVKHASERGRAGRLSNEALLIAPDRDQHFETKFGRLSVKANSFVLVVSTDKCLTVFNLDDRSRGSVAVHLGSGTVILEPGRHLTISRASAGNFSAVNPVKFVPHRKLMTTESGDCQIHRSEFYLPSIIGGLPQLREFIRSSEPSKRTAASHMLKTAAILNSLVSADGDHFELYNEDLVTAYNH